VFESPESRGSAIQNRPMQMNEGKCQMIHAKLDHWLAAGRLFEVEVRYSAYCASPLPNDQFSFFTSTRLMKASSRRSPTASWSPSAGAL
jgi:hypothetical protein